MALTSSEFIGLVCRVSTLLAWILLPVNFPHCRLPPGHPLVSSSRCWPRRPTPRSLHPVTATAGSSAEDLRVRHCICNNHVLHRTHLPQHRRSPRWRLQPRPEPVVVVFRSARITQCRGTCSLHDADLIGCLKSYQLNARALLRVVNYSCYIVGRLFLIFFSLSFYLVCSINTLFVCTPVILVYYVTKTALAKLPRLLGAAAEKASSRIERAVSEQ
jgi:hypothetical protein